MDELLGLKKDVADGCQMCFHGMVAYALFPFFGFVWIFPWAIGALFHGCLWIAICDSFYAVILDKPSLPKPMILNLKYGWISI